MRYISIFTLVLVIALQAWSAEPVDDSFPNPTLQLVKVKIERAQQFDALGDIGMEIAENRGEAVIAYATPQQVKDAKEIGFPVEIIDAEIPQLIQVSIDYQQLNALADLDLDIFAMQLEHIQALARQKQTQAIRARGFRVDVLEENIYTLVQPPPPGVRRARTLTSERYHSYSEVNDSLSQLAAEHPDIAMVIDIGDTVEGRDILAIKISDNPTQDEDHEPDILFVGCHHAREWVAVETPFRLAQYLIENYATDSRVRAMVDRGEIYIVPIVNPDGYVYTWESFEQRLWRKNRRDNGDGTFGVDLNRNYDFAWGKPGSSPSTSSQTYHGTAPFSEPETRAIRDLTLSHDFAAYMDYHSYGQLILYPWGFSRELASDAGLMGHIAEYMSRQIEAVHGERYRPAPGGRGLYILSGGMTDWIYNTFEIPAFLTELRDDKGGHGFELPEDQIKPTFEENLPAALYLIEWTQSTDRTAPMTSVSVTEGPFKVGDEITVTFVAEPNGVAKFSIEGVTDETIEMTEDETAPGIYTGTYTIDDAFESVITVTFRDIWGNLGVDANHRVDMRPPPITEATVTDADNAYVNWEEIHIKVTSELDAEVTVDLSPLDSTAGTIELDESYDVDGLFEGEVLINRKNTNPAGVKQLLITATDEAGNVSKETLEVILQRETTLALGEGINLISAPVKPSEDWKLSDLARFIGPEVTLIGRYKSGGFQVYLPGSPETSPANVNLRGAEAYVVGMASHKRVTFAGIGWNEQLTLKEGENFVAVPRTVEDWRLSDLAAHIGPDVRTIFAKDAANGKFVKYEPNAPASSSTNLPVKGGMGYVVVMTGPATIAFDGDAWQDTGASTIPLAVHDTTPFLLIKGMTTPQGTNVPLNGLKVEVTNLNTGLRNADITGQLVGDGGYAVSLADFETNRAGQFGDSLQITITDPKGSLDSKTLTHQLTPQDIRSSVVSLDIQLSSLPVVSALLLPYPNPFNPDVWIPYQLAKPANVTISIYDFQGQLVRNLDIGQQAAGIYVNRDEAMHWDGRNHYGEAVASGPYFYTLRGGAFTATGKMVLLR